MPVDDDKHGPLPAGSIKFASSEEHLLIALRQLVLDANFESVLYVGLAQVEILNVLATSPVRELHVIDQFDRHGLEAAHWAEDDESIAFFQKQILDTPPDLRALRKRFQFYVEGRPRKVGLLIIDLLDQKYLDSYTRDRPKVIMIVGDAAGLSLSSAYSWTASNGYHLGTRGPLV